MERGRGWRHGGRRVHECCLGLKRKAERKRKIFGKKGDEEDRYDIWAKDVMERDETKERSHRLGTIKMPL
jgi:hypothetical protein